MAEINWWNTYRYQYLQNILLPCSVEGEAIRTDDLYLFNFYLGELSDEPIIMVSSILKITTGWIILFLFSLSIPHLWFHLLETGRTGRKDTWKLPYSAKKRMASLEHESRILAANFPDFLYWFLANLPCLSAECVENHGKNQYILRSGYCFHISTIRCAFPKDTVVARRRFCQLLQEPLLFRDCMCFQLVSGAKLLA